MEQLNLITNFLRIKDKNITITDEYDMGTHLELHGHLDYTAPKCPKCKGQMAKYDFQKASKIPYLETAGYPLLIRLRKRRFKCKDCGKIAVAETPLVKKNHQISVAVNQKIAQLLIENQAMKHIAHRLSISTSSVMRKLNEFKFETDWNTLPEVMSWESNSLGIDCLSCLQKGENELHRSRFQFPKCHNHSGRKNSSNHPKPLSTLS